MGNWFTEEMKKSLNMVYGTEAIKEKKPMEFNVGDLVHVQLFGYGVILEIQHNYKGTLTNMYLVRLIDRDETFWFSGDHLTLIRRMGEKDMAGIRNKKTEKETTKKPLIECSADDLYQAALDAAKKMSNSMYGVGHSVSATVLRNDFNRFLNEVKDIKFSGPATIVFWKDGTKTVVKCQEGEHYDPKDGIKYALLKKIAGGTSNQALKMGKKYDEWLEKWIPENLKSETAEPSENEESKSNGSESTIMKATEKVLGEVMEEDPFEKMSEVSSYLAEEMKKRIIGLNELADTVKAATDKVRSATEEVRKAKDLYFKGNLNDRSEETEEK